MNDIEPRKKPETELEIAEQEVEDAKKEVEQARNQFECAEIHLKWAEYRLRLVREHEDWRRRTGLTSAEITQRIMSVVTAFREGTSINVLSTGERIAVALVVGKPELFPPEHYTILEAVNRLGPDWTAAAVKAQRLLDTV
jgi:hypothetical protein